MSHGMSRRNPLQTAAHRLRRWLPAVTVLWALAATVAVLQPCRDAFAASLPHPHGPQVASAAHDHAHGSVAGTHHSAGETLCQCADLAPPFTATVADDLGTTPEGEKGIRSAPLAASPLWKARTAPTFPRLPPDPASYLATSRLLI